MEKVYTKEECYKLAKQCKTRSEFKSKYRKAYYESIKNNYDDDYDWFPKRKKPQGYWEDKERCVNELAKYSTRVEASIKASGAYDSACTHGWLQDIPGLGYVSLPNGYWTFEKCYEIAKNYTYIKDFRLNERKVYDASYSHKWLDQFTWLKHNNIDLFNDFVDSVYSYEFKELNSVYVGRTLMKRQKDRDNEHRKITKDTVYKFSIVNNISIPKMKILEENLTLDEGSKKEGEWENYYYNNGWNIINIKKTGGIGKLKRWTQKECENIAKKYTSRSDFRKFDTRAYEISKKYGWIDNFIWLTHGTLMGYWNVKENCEKESKKYTSRTDFCNNSNGAYTSSLEHGWLDEFVWLVPKVRKSGYWKDKKHCEELALTCEKRSEFKNKSTAAYKWAKENKWLDEWFD